MGEGRREQNPPRNTKEKERKEKERNKKERKGKESNVLQNIRLGDCVSNPIPSSGMTRRGSADFLTLFFSPNTC